MSAYMSFFIRANDNFYPIGTYSRSTAIYEIFEEALGVPWEHIISINEDNLVKVVNAVNINVDGFNAAIVSLNEKIDFIKTATNSFGDKLEEYGYVRETIDDYKDRISDLNQVISFAHFLGEMIDDVKYSEGIEGIDFSKYIYVGIEIGHPTIDDINERN